MPPYFRRIESTITKKPINVIVGFIVLLIYFEYYFFNTVSDELSTFRVIHALLMSGFGIAFIIKGFGKNPFNIFGKTFISINETRIRYKPFFHVSQFKIDWKDIRSIQLNQEVIAFKTTYNHLKILELGRLEPEIIQEMEAVITTMAKKKDIAITGT